MSSPIFSSKESIFHILDEFCSNIFAYRTNPDLFTGSVVAMRKALEAMACYLFTYSTKSGNPITLREEKIVFEPSFWKQQPNPYHNIVFDRDGSGDATQLYHFAKNVSAALHYQAYSQVTASGSENELPPSKQPDFVAYHEQYSKFDVSHIEQFRKLLEIFLHDIGCDVLEPKFKRQYEFIHLVLNDPEGSDIHQKKRQKQFLSALEDPSTPTWLSYICGILNRNHRAQDTISKDTVSALNRIIAEKASAVTLAKNGKVLKDKQSPTMEEYRQLLENLKKDKDPDINIDRILIIDHVRIISLACNNKLHFRIKDHSRKAKESNFSNYDNASCAWLVNRLVVGIQPESIQLWITKHEAEIEVLLRELEYEKKQRARLKKLLWITWSVIGLVVTALLVFGFISFFKNIPRVNKFGDYIWQNGAPQGIFPLTEAEASARAHYYAITTKNGRVISVEHRNAMDVAADETDPHYLTRPTICDVHYADGTVDYLVYKNAAGQGLFALDYSPDLERVELKDAYTRSDSAYLPASVADFRMSQWQESYNSDSIHGDFSKINSLSLTRDENGRVLLAQFQTGDEDLTDQNGLRALRYSYDSVGRLSTVEYLYQQNESPVQEDVRLSRQQYYYDMEHISQVTSFYTDGSSRTVTCRYDTASHAIASVSYGDLTGQLTSNEDGISIAQYRYDPETGLLSSLRYYNQNSEPVLSGMGYAAVTYLYEDGQLREQSYLDAEGQLIAGPEGFARKVIEYDKKAGSTKTSYRDKDNRPYTMKAGYTSVLETTKKNVTTTFRFSALDNPVTFDEGVYGKRTTLGSDNRISLLEYLDQDGNPMLSNAGYTAVRYEYNPAGLLESESYLGLDGKPVMRTGNGCARIEYQYNGKQQVTLTTRYALSADNQYVLHPNYAYISRHYDGLGRSDNIQYQDANKNLVSGPDGYALEQRTFTETADGITVNLYYLDAQYQPVMNTAVGYSSFEKKFDHSDNCTYEAYFGADQLPIINQKLGYASSVNGYDENGNWIYEAFFGADGNLLLMENKGYAAISLHYDEAGNMDYWAYYGPDKKLYMNPIEGFAAIKQEYDENGNLVLETLYNEKEEVFVSPVYGRAILKQRFENNHCVYWGYFNENEQPIINPKKGFSSIKKDYNASGNCIYEAYFDENDAPMIHPEYGYASKKNGYDSNGNNNYWAYYDENGDLFINPIKGYAYTKKEFDENGNWVCDTLYDQNDQKHISPVYGYAIEKLGYDKYNNLNYWAYFDENEQPIINAVHGYSYINKTFDLFGNCTHEAFFDQNGSPLYVEKYGYASAIYQYENGNTTFRAYYGEDGNLMIHPEYGYAILKSIYNEDGQEIECSYYGIDEKPMPKKDRGFYSVKFDYGTTENGWWRLERYFDAEGAPMYVPFYGGYALRFEYDSNNNNTAIYTFDENDQLTIGSKGYAVLKQQFDENNNCTYWAFYNESEHLFVNKQQGYAILKQSYDKNNHCDGWVYCDENAQPMIHPEYGYASIKKEYDNNGYCIYEAFFDASGDPMISPEYGYASIKKEYDNNGYRIYEAFFDASGDPMIHPDKGYASIKYEYDKNGYCTFETYFDVDGNPMIPPEYGYASIKKEYDNNGYRIYEAFFGTDGNPMIPSEYGYASAKYRYDQYDICVYEAYFDVDGKPMLHPEYGYASIEEIYDHEDTCLYRAYFDTEGKLFTHADSGYAFMKAESTDTHYTRTFYDENGSPVLPEDYGYATEAEEYAVFDGEHCITSRIFYGVDGKCIFNEVEGYAFMKCTYDDQGNRLTETHYDADGNILLHLEPGAISYRQEFDQNGNCTFTGYIDEEENPILHPEYGYASIRHEFDQNGNKISWTYFGVDGQPMLHPQYNYASIKQIYDEKGNVISLAYFGVDGNPILHPDHGYASIQNEYDANGNPIFWAFFGLDGNPMLHQKEGYASVKNEYDQRGNVVSQSYFGLDGEPILRKGCGYASMKQEFDQNNNLICQSFFGTAGEPVISDFGYASTTLVYDADENLTQQQYFDTEGNPIPSPTE